MNKLNIVKIFVRYSVALAAVSLAFSLTGIYVAEAATTPPLGAAAGYGVLANTYTDPSAATTVSGSVGFTTPPASAIAGVHPFYGSGAPYSTAGTDQGAALTALAAQACTYTFAAGAVDLSSDTGHGPIAVYTPGIYCATGAMSMVGPVTFSGSGTYIFRAIGALNTTAGAVVTLAGASACDIFWTPTGATTFGANTTFAGTVIGDAGITVGANSTWTGRALAFGGTVTTDTGTITVPTCPATLQVIKLVVNGSGGAAVASDFNVHVKNAGVDVAGSPAAGIAAPGAFFSIASGTYTVSEDANASYVQTFTGDCDSSGNITLISSDNKICTVVNTDIPPPAPVVVSGGGGGGGSGLVVPAIGLLKVPTPLALPSGSGSVTYNYTVWNVGGQQALTDITVTDDKCSPVSLLSGDENSDSKLDPGEVWKYSCTGTLAETTTSTSVATGYSDNVLRQAAIATAIATVVVTSPQGFPNAGLSAPLIAPLINVIKIPSILTPLPLGGGNVTYAYVVTNPGAIPMSDVRLTDDKCSPTIRNSGDANSNDLLDPGETWGYTCAANISTSIRNVATAQGSGNGFTALGYAFATVLVTGTPGFPNTGLAPLPNSAAWNTIFSLMFIFVSMSLIVVLRKSKA